MTPKDTGMVKELADKIKVMMVEAKIKTKGEREKRKEMAGEAQLKTAVLKIIMEEGETPAQTKVTKMEEKSLIIHKETVEEDAILLEEQTIKMTTTTRKGQTKVIAQHGTISINPVNSAKLIMKADLVVQLEGSNLEWEMKLRVRVQVGVLEVKINVTTKRVTGRQMVKAEAVSHHEKMLPVIRDKFKTRLMREIFEVENLMAAILNLPKVLATSTLSLNISKLSRN
jgi:hypothetical protein